MQTALKEFQGNNRVRLGFVASFILLLLAIGFSTINDNHMRQQTTLVYHTYTVISDVSYLLGKVKDAETGVRGYIGTGQPEFLEPYHGARDKADSAFRKIADETKDNPTQKTRLKDLKAMINMEFAMLDEQLLFMSDAGKIGAKRFALQDSLTHIMSDSRIVMDSIRTKIAAVQKDERALLANRQSMVDESFSNLGTFTVVALFVALVLFSFGLFINIKENKLRKLAVKRIRNLYGELENRVAELDTANADLIRMKAQEKFAVTGRIARTIAHEIRNPLTNINLSVNQLQADFLADNQDAGFLFTIVYRNSDRINHLITELLQSTKFSELHFKTVDADVLLNETLNDAKDRLSLANIELVKRYAMPSPKIFVDEKKIKIALLNIIINAVEAMEKVANGKLTIETRRVNDNCEIRITDNGCGMNEESVSKIFEPYFTKKMKGGGLGLTNTQNIILNHQGEVQVLSEEGVGTTFSISLKARP